MKSLRQYLEVASREKWSTGHFNASESDQMRAIVEAAKDVGTIAIIGTSEGEAKHLGLSVACGIRDGLRKEFSAQGGSASGGGTPVFLNADHHKSVESAKAAIDAGYDSIHIDLSLKSYLENVAGTKEIVDYAHAKDASISVEGELGYIGGESKLQKEKIEIKPEDYTDPEQAKDYVDRTGVDRLAIAVGNAHGISIDEPTLDINRIKQIRKLVPETVALVLHAGSGIPDEQIKSAIAAGITNIHINTDIRVGYTAALRKTLNDEPEETAPYKFDAPAREALRELVKQKLVLFNLLNKI